MNIANAGLQYFKLLRWRQKAQLCLKWQRQRMDKRFKLRSAGDVIDILGGTVELARRLEVDPRVVSNWRSRGFPSGTYWAFIKLLDQKGIVAPRSLWRQREIAK
jgi:hypothetical protein